MVEKQNGWRLQSPSNIYDLPTQQILFFSSCCIGTRITSSLTICMIDSPINKKIPMPPTNLLPLIILKVFINRQYNSTNWLIQKQRTTLMLMVKIMRTTGCTAHVQFYFVNIFVMICKCNSIMTNIKACNSLHILKHIVLFYM